MELKVYVDSYISLIKDNFDYIKSNDWTKIEKIKSREEATAVDYYSTVKSKEEEFELQDTLVDFTVERLSKLVSAYKGEKKDPLYGKFLSLCKNMIEYHTTRCIAYPNNFKYSTIEKASDRLLEVKLQQKVATATAKIVDKVTGFNLTLEDEIEVVEFLGDKKAPLIMHYKLIEMFPSIRDKVEKMGIDFDTEPEPTVHILNTKPPQWDIKKHYFEQDKDTLQYYVDEWKKIQRGIIIDGVYITPWMYYHMNFFTTKYPHAKYNNKSKRVETKDIIGVPPLRDNEWWTIIDNYEVAKSEGLMMFLAATRRAAKTTMQTSHLGHCVVTNRLELVVAGGSSKDLDVLQKNFEILQENIHPAFKIPLILEQWGKRVELGIKTKDNKSIVNSFLKIINMDGGTKSKSEIFAGLTPDAVIIDEVMKLPFSSQLDGLKPAIDQPAGKRCVVILAGCVCKGTKVFDAKGKVHNIEDIKLGDTILGYDGVGASVENVSWVKPPAKKPCYRVTLEDGTTLECSNDHPILTKNKCEGARFERTENITEGDIVYTLDPESEEIIESIQTTYGDKGEYFAGKNNFKGVKSKTVKSVEFIGEQDVYNITADTTHTYIANGIITHNTAGNEDLAKDAFDYLREPEANEVLSMPWDVFNSRVPEEHRTWQERPFGTFIPAQMSAKEGMVKKDSNLSEYLGIKSELLSSIPIKVTDWKTSKELIQSDRDKKRKKMDSYTKEVLYYPMCPSDMLLSTKVNPFPVQEAIAHREYLKQIGGTGKKGFLIQKTTGEIEFEMDETKELANYPFKGGFIDAPVVLYEDLPTERPADYLYVSGFDDYKQDESDTDSIGSFHIYKLDVGLDDMCGKIVASFATRPDPHEKLHYQIYLLQQAFNAKCFMENADLSYKDFLERRKVVDKWLMTSLDFEADLASQSQGRRKYGWAPTPKNKKNLFQKFVHYTRRIFQIYDKDGNEIEVLGVQMIDDIQLLDEIISYQEGNNVDRITSFMSCLGFEDYLTANYMAYNPNRNIEKRREENRKIVRNNGGSGPFFRKTRSKYFR